ncbi:hypothetical protein TCAL_14661 [Tigriopus californicus]|uniref:DUF7041 domain-containing protein n=1 Tax=Tigriopus californicus TaxID=6832 RepID=A0A553NPC2_TIGCA|nr:hypothetical protein TCAL_14661 [Tigriopus californicus]
MNDLHTYTQLRINHYGKQIQVIYTSGQVYVIQRGGRQRLRQMNESQFSIRGITQEETKYHHLVASLDQDTACRVVATLQSPPVDQPYSKLKEQLVKTFTLSKHERAQRLLHLPPLGDRKPSELMDLMLALYGSAEPDFLFRALFLEKLLEDICCHLMHLDDNGCRNLALRADSFMVARKLHSEVHAVSRPSSGPTKKKLNKPTGKGSLCKYHSRYGDKAYYCVSPCLYQKPRVSEVFHTSDPSMEAGNEFAGRQ